jgi:hypothetical protein
MWNFKKQALARHDITLPGLINLGRTCQQVAAQVEQVSSGTSGPARNRELNYEVTGNRGQRHTQMRQNHGDMNRPGTKTSPRVA